MSNKKAQLRCLFHHILVEMDELDNYSKGGIIIPPTTERTTHTGIIHYVGQGAVLSDGSIRKLSVKVGERVLFGKFAGMPIIINGINYRHMREDEIIAVIDEGEIEVQDDED